MPDETNSSIKKDMQELDVGDPIVELYEIDATNLEGGEVYHFTPGPLDGEAVESNGVVYLPIPVKSQGFEFDGNGKMPRPTIEVSNISYQFMGVVKSLNDLCGAKVTRTRTYQKYLDGQVEADPFAKFPSQIYYIERKTRQNKLLIEWELKAKIDMEGTLIPKGQVLETCTHRYRIWDESEGEWIDHSNNDEITCPYLGVKMYDAEGNEVFTESEDKCGRKLFDCQQRYPETDAYYKEFGLPTRGFPAIGKIGSPYR